MSFKLYFQFVHKIISAKKYSEGGCTLNTANATHRASLPWIFNCPKLTPTNLSTQPANTPECQKIHQFDGQAVPDNVHSSFGRCREVNITFIQKTASIQLFIYNLKLTQVIQSSIKLS